MINPKDFKPEEIAALCERAMAVMSATDHICGSTSIGDIDLHQTNLENAEGELTHLLNFLDMKIGEMKNSAGAVKAMLKDVARHKDRSKRSYWNLKKSPSLS